MNELESAMNGMGRIDKIRQLNSFSQSKQKPQDNKLSQLITEFDDLKSEVTTLKEENEKLKQEVTGYKQTFQQDIENQDKRIEFAYEKTLVNNLEQISTQTQVVRLENILSANEFENEELDGDVSDVSLEMKYVHLLSDKEEATKYGFTESLEKINKMLEFFEKQVNQEIVSSLLSPDSHSMESTDADSVEVVGNNASDIDSVTE